MPPPNLSPEDYSNPAELLRATINADRFPLSPRIQSQNFPVEDHL